MSKRAYKYRCYPTDEQRQILAQTFGCVRFIYNFGLHTRSVAYKEQGKNLNYHEFAALLPSLKEQFPWLKEVSSVTLQQSLRHLDTAFKNFFEGRAYYPAFKKRQNAQSAARRSSDGWDRPGPQINGNSLNRGSGWQSSLFPQGREATGKSPTTARQEKERVQESEESPFESGSCACTNQ
jgi:transposase